MINIYLFFFLIQYAAKSYIFLEFEMHNILVTKMKVCIREETYTSITKMKASFKNTKILVLL